MKTLTRIITSMLYWICLTLFALGLALFLLNIASLVIPLRSPAVYNHYNKPEMDVLYTYPETMAQINRQPGETDAAYVPRLTELISQSISPYWNDEIDKFRLRVPIWENYVLWAYSFIDPRVYLRYEYNDYKIALERGVGLCSEYALVLSQILEENGVETEMVGLAGHVLNLVKIDEKWRVVDANYNLVFPYTLEELEANPQIVAEYYQTTWAPEFISDYFASTDNNVVIDTAYAYTGARTVEFERWAYRVVWLIPLALAVPFLLFQTARFFYRKAIPRRVEEQGIRLQAEN